MGYSGKEEYGRCNVGGEPFLVFHFLLLFVFRHGSDVMSSAIRRVELANNPLVATRLYERR